MALFDNRYELEHLLGRGAFAEVWQAKDERTGVTLALKIYAPSTGMDDDGIEGMTHEFSLMVNANHQNLLRPMYFDICDRKPYLVLPFCGMGNISNRVGQFSEHDTWKLLRDVAAGLAYLHGMKPPVIHQDIKPANILMADDGTFMITDFGVSINARSTMQQAAAKDIDSGGTIAYMAPERFSKNNRPIMANDIFSLGCMAYEMLVGELPFGNHGGLLPLNGAEIPDIPNDVSQELKDVIAQCLAKEPWDRPRAQQLEEIANQALGHTPTVFTTARSMPKEPATQSAEPSVNQPAAPSVAQQPMAPDTTETGHEATLAVQENVRTNNPYNATIAAQQSSNAYNTPLTYNPSAQETSSGKKWIGLVAVLVIVLGIGGFFLLQSGNKVDPEAEVIPQETSTQTDPAATVENPNLVSVGAHEEQQAEENLAKQAKAAEQQKAQESQTASTSKESSSKTKSDDTQAKSATATTKTKDESTSASATQQSGTLNLGYATWKGSVKNGNPDGNGTLTFTSSHIIDSRDPERHQAQAGDRVEGQFSNGHLEYGKWYKSDGTVESLLIGM